MDKKLFHKRCFLTPICTQIFWRGTILDFFSMEVILVPIPLSHAHEELQAIFWYQNDLYPAIFTSHCCVFALGLSAQLFPLPFLPQFQSFPSFLTEPPFILLKSP